MGAILEDVAWVSTGICCSQCYYFADVRMAGEAVLDVKLFSVFYYFLFTIASMLCGNSHTLTELVVFRIMGACWRWTNIQCTGNITRDLATGEEEPLLRYLVSDGSRSHNSTTGRLSYGSFIVAMGILY